MTPRKTLEEVMNSVNPVDPTFLQGVTLDELTAYVSTTQRFSNTETQKMMSYIVANLKEYAHREGATKAETRAVKQTIARCRQNAKSDVFRPIFAEYIISALAKAVHSGDKKNITQFVQAYEDALVRGRPRLPEEKQRHFARRMLASVAYAADNLGRSAEEVFALNPPDEVFQNYARYGQAMRIMKTIFKSKGVDIRTVLE